MTCAEQTRLVQMLKSREPHAKIARALNTTAQAVSHFAVQAGLRRRNPYRVLTLAEVREIQRRIKRGETPSLLAREYNVSRTTVWRFAKSVSLERRLRTEQNVNKVLRALRRYPYRNNAYIAAHAGVDRAEVKRVKSLLRYRDNRDHKLPRTAALGTEYTIVDWLEQTAPEHGRPAGEPTENRQRKLTPGTKKHDFCRTMVGGQSKRAVDVLLQQYGIA